MSLGANATSRHGNSADTLDFAISRLSVDSVKLLQTSPYYTTPAFPAGSGPDFINAAISLETTLSADALLQLIHRIEAEAGRTRNKRWGARTLDIDLLTFHDAILPDPKTYQFWRGLPLDEQMVQAPEQLILPHPRIQDRAFVLIPLRDIAPDWVHPVSLQAIDTLISALPRDEIDSIRPLKR